MLALTLTPAVLSLLLLAAHFLRRGNLLMCAAVLGVLATLLAVRRPWAPRLVQIVLGAATLLWARTLAELTQQRLAEGEPAGRLVAILGAVIAVNVLGLLLLGAGRVTRAFAAEPARGPARP